MDKMDIYANPLTFEILQKTVFEAEEITKRNHISATRRERINIFINCLRTNFRQDFFVEPVEKMQDDKIKFEKNVSEYINFNKEIINKKLWNDIGEIGYTTNKCLKLLCSKLKRKYANDSTYFYKIDKELEIMNHDLYDFEVLSRMAQKSNKEAEILINELQELLN